jgi:parvulin-like peptidyl-prolyl isomerase
MRSLSRRLGPVAAALLLVGVGYILGSVRTDPLAAQPAAKGVVPAAGTAPAAAPPAAADKRVVAYIFGTTPITREEFGDYLIQLIGQDRVRLYVNRRIIETAAAQRGITVTPQEVSTIIEQDCAKLGMKKEQFLATVLAQKYGKTEAEWREDVIKPRLMVQAMCKSQLKLDDVELKKVYDSLYGEKVQCRVILWQKGNEKEILRIYNDLRQDPKAFDAAARSQPYSDLAAKGGEVDPVGRHSGPATAKFEEIAFALKEGQVSEMIDTGNGIMVIKRIGTVPARADVSFESVKPQLVKELTDRQMDELVPKMFAQLNTEAKPLFILTPKGETREELEERSKRLGVDPAALDKGK